MESFIIWLSNNFVDFIANLSFLTVNMINTVFFDYGYITQDLSEFDINLALFSDTPILSTNGFDLLLLFFSIFYTVIFIVIVYKIVKKVVVKITGWKRW